MPHHWGFEHEEPVNPDDYIIARARLRKTGDYEKENPSAFTYSRCKDCGEIYNKFTSQDLAGKRCNSCLHKRAK